MTLPPVIFLLVLASITGTGIWPTVLVISLLSWPLLARMIRSRLLELREAQFQRTTEALERVRQLAEQGLVARKDVTDAERMQAQARARVDETWWREAISFVLGDSR